MTTFATTFEWIEHVLTGCNPPQGVPIDAESDLHRVGLWLMLARPFGQVGLSSSALARELLLIDHPNDRIDYPHDAGDFDRCVFLIEQVPNARYAVKRLAQKSPYWAALEPEWDSLTDMWNDEKDIPERDWCDTYDRLKELLEPVEAEQRANA